MGSVVTEIIQIMTSGLTGIGTAVGNGLTSMVQSIFLTGAGTSDNPYALSVFGGVIAVFAGISLAFGLSRWVLNFVTSLGNRNR